MTYEEYNNEFNPYSFIHSNTKRNIYFFKFIDYLIIREYCILSNTYDLLTVLGQMEDMDLKSRQYALKIIIRFLWNVDIRLLENNINEIDYVLENIINLKFDKKLILEKFSQSEILNDLLIKYELI